MTNQGPTYSPDYKGDATPLLRDIGSVFVSQPPIVSYGPDWATLRAEAAIRIYCEMHPRQPPHMAVLLADQLIAELRKVKP